MKQGWEEKRLIDICDFYNGLWTGKKPPYLNVGVIRNTNFSIDGQLNFADIAYLDVEESLFKKKKLIYGDIILEKSGGGPKQPVGRVVAFEEINGDFSFSNFTSVIRIKNKEEISHQFLLKYLHFQYICGNTEKMQSHSIGIRNLIFEEYKSLIIPLPPLPEQKRILAILDKAFSVIDKAKENAQKNLQNAKELFESYLNSVFANPGADWERKKLGDVTEFKSGTTIPVKYEKKEGDLLYIKVGDMNLLENQVKITSSSRFASSKEISPNQIISSGSVIFPKRGGAIATNKKRRIVKPTIVDLNTMAITPNKVIDVDFFYWWFLTVDLIKISNGTTIPQINNYSFENTYISYPKSIEKQKEIAQNFLDISALSTDLQKLYRQKILALDELKKSILQKAFNGELKTTSEIEI